MKYRFEIATGQDDEGIRCLLRETSMEGPIEVVFTKEPNFFHAQEVEGTIRQVLIARGLQPQDIVVMGCRSTKPVFINGNVTDIGYLSGLRIHPSARKAALLAQGYQYLHEQHSDGKAPIYLTTIFEENRQARELLTSQRAGLPVYADRGQYCTAVVGLQGRKKSIRKDISIEKGSFANLDEIVACLIRNGKEKQFYPYYTKEYFWANGGALRGFHPKDFYVARKNNRVLGVIAKWDQGAFKQILIAGYNGTVKFGRPIYNLMAVALGWPRLPKPNQRVNSFYASFIAVDNNDPEIFKTLLNTIYNDHLDSEYDYLMVGLHERDPLLRVVRREHRSIDLLSRLFAVYWDDGVDFYNQLDNRVPYLELATL